ncbi:MAG: hypothetical protein RDU20_17110 [Desulfomonilaceae bacterium]|nr:hypothetical protein [Desulfomonilaceae bacterium]
MRLLDAKVVGRDGAFRLSLLGTILLFMSWLPTGTASAQVADPYRTGTTLDTLPTFGLADVFRGLPSVGSVDRYLRDGVITFYVGKIHSMARHTRYELESTGAVVPLIRHVNYICAQYGVWLGAALKMPLSEGLGLNAEGWKLVPVRREAYGTYFHNQDPPRPGDLPSAMDFWREWIPDTDAWFGDVFLTVSPGLDGYVNGLWAVCGGRYDHYGRVLHHSLSRGLNLASAKDEMEMTVRMLIPYIGVQVGRDGTRYDMTVRMVGTPIVLGGLQHGETFGGIGARDEGWFQFHVPRGYWAELFVDAGVQLTERISLGGFLKMTTMTLMSNADVTRHSMGDGSTRNENYDLIYRRLMYTFGARAALRF